MNRWAFRALLPILGVLSISTGSGGQEVRGISGRILDPEGRPVPGATVLVEGEGVETSSDREGRFSISGLSEGIHLLRITMLGFAPYETTVTVPGESGPVVVRLEIQPLPGESLVVTATRIERLRKDAPVVVEVLDDKIFEATHTVTLSEGMNSQPGVRLEVNCQTCNYTQIRMNGLGGSYSQILIDSRPVFSALNGLYGIEQIPRSMIERVEVVRGGGSALYGSSAIAGTVNIITREPIDDGFEISLNRGHIGGSRDRSLSLVSTVADERQGSGLCLFGLLRSRDAYDANADGFSELPRIRNNSLGLRAFYRPDASSRLSVEAHGIFEERRGGNRLDAPPHEADQAEERVHRIFGGGAEFSRAFGRSGMLSLYASGQHTGRDHYTGVGRDPEAYGSTENATLVAGAQVTGRPIRSWEVTGGVEYTFEDVDDRIPGFGISTIETTHQLGVFGQAEWRPVETLSLLAGARLDRHRNLEHVVLNPRASVLVDLSPELQWRASTSTGFRAPQAFDADLHIALAGGGISYIRRDPDLVKEHSVSYSTSLDLNHRSPDRFIGATVEAFHTRLYDAFVLEDAGEDADGNSILERRNGGNSTVRGVTLSARIAREGLSLETGLTLQQSRYDDPVTWSEDLPPTGRYLRTPSVYGFYTTSWSPLTRLTLYLSGTLTGPMNVLHLQGNIPTDEIEHSRTFHEANLKASYEVGPTRSVFLSLGVQNLLDAYQDDFDVGAHRDSNYVYGPARPRTFFFAIKVAR